MHLLVSHLFLTFELVTGVAPSATRSVAKGETDNSSVSIVSKKMKIFRQRRGCFWGPRVDGILMTLATLGGLGTLKLIGLA